MYIADTGNNRIRKVTNGVITTVAGTGTAGYNGDGGSAISAELNLPQGIAVDSFGNLYIADTSNHRIRKVTPGGIITTVVGTGTVGYSGDGGIATLAQLKAPTNIAIDYDGNMYITDLGNDSIRKVNICGIISTIAGNGSFGFSGDGGPAINAKLNDPYGITFDYSGNLYFSDLTNNRIRKLYYA